jgi:hypothetical protein
MARTMIAMVSSMRAVIVRLTAKHPLASAQTISDKKTAHVLFPRTMNEMKQNATNSTMTAMARLTKDARVWMEQHKSAGRILVFARKAKRLVAMVNGVLVRARPKHPPKKYATA